MASSDLCRPGPAKAYGWLAAVLALISQLALGSMLPPDDAAIRQRAALDTVSILCTHSNPPVGREPASHRHHAGDVALCPLGIALALCGSMLTPSAPVIAPPPILLVQRMQERPPGRGPPPPTARVGVPRAPPVTA